MIISGLMAGTLDIFCAVIFLAGGNFVSTLKFIAKGAVGITAFTGGDKMAFLGLCIHYFIAFFFAALYFYLFPYLGFLKKQRIISGLLYGMFIWAVMHFLVLPFTHNPPAAFILATSWKEVLILMLAVGVPVAWLTAKHYS